MSLLRFSFILLALLVSKGIFSAENISKKVVLRAKVKESGQVCSLNELALILARSSKGRFEVNSFCDDLKADISREAQRPEKWIISRGTWLFDSGILCDGTRTNEMWMLNLEEQTARCVAKGTAQKYSMSTVALARSNLSKSDKGELALTYEDKALYDRVSLAWEGVSSYLGAGSIHGLKLPGFVMKGGCYRSLAHRVRITQTSFPSGNKHVHAFEPEYVTSGKGYGVSLSGGVHISPQGLETVIELNKKKYCLRESKDGKETTLYYHGVYKVLWTGTYLYISYQDAEDHIVRDIFRKTRFPDGQFYFKRFRREKLKSKAVDISFKEFWKLKKKKKKKSKPKSTTGAKAKKRRI